MTTTYAIRLTGILGDTWLYGQRFSSRTEARRYAHFILNKGFDTGTRSNVKSVQVIEVKK